MTQTATIYRRTSADTIRFGWAPTYWCEEPYHSDYEMIWSDPVQITAPEGYTIAAGGDGNPYLYDSAGQHEPIVDDDGHPAIILWIGQRKDGKPYARYLRLDGQGGDDHDNP